MKEGAGAPRLVVGWLIVSIRARADGELPSDDSCHTALNEGATHSGDALRAPRACVRRVCAAGSHLPSARVACGGARGIRHCHGDADLRHRRVASSSTVIKYLEHLTRLPTRSSEAPSVADDAAAGHRRNRRSPRGFVDWPMEGRKTAERDSRGADRSRARREDVRRAAGYLGVAHEAAAVRTQEVPLEARCRWPRARRTGQHHLPVQQRLRAGELHVHRLRARRQAAGLRRPVQGHAPVLRRATAAANRRRQRHASRNRCGRLTGQSRSPKGSVESQRDFSRKALPPL